MRHLLPWMLLAIVATPLAAAEDLEAEARRIEGRLMAPCCMANTLAEHHSPLALRMRTEIRQMLAQGRTEDEIVDHYVAEFGELVRAAPEAKGFSLLAWILPGIVLILGSAAVYLVARGWSASRPEEEPEPDTPRSFDPAYLERLQRELRDRG